MVQPQEIHRPPLRSVLETHTTVTAATYTAKAGDRLIGVNRAGAVTITFPTAQLRPGRTYTVKDESGAAATNNITVATEGAETIDGSATDTISENYGSKIYYSDGSNWFTVPLLAVGSHTLASHSAKAHSDLTGIGTGDHHAQSHALDSHTGTLKHEKGGLEADVNAGDGFVEIKGGVTTVIKSNTAATAVPGATDDSAAGYAVGSVWVDTTNDKAYVCLDAAAAAAVWTEVTQAGSAGSDISARVYNSAAITISNATDTALTFNSERFDTDTIHSTVSNTGHLTATTAGVYVISATIEFAANATGQRTAWLRLNGATLIASLTFTAGAADGHAIAITTIYKLAATDYVEIGVYQDSGGNLDVISGANKSPEFAMAKILG